MSDRVWMCRFTGCTKTLPLDGDGQVPVIAVNSHLKSHGMQPLPARSKPVTGGSVGKSSERSGGWLDSVFEGIGDFIDTLTD